MFLAKLIIVIYYTDCRDDANSSYEIGKLHGRAASNTSSYSSGRRNIRKVSHSPSDQISNLNVANNLGSFKMYILSSNKYLFIFLFFITQLFFVVLLQFVLEKGEIELFLMNEDTAIHLTNESSYSRPSSSAAINKTSYSSTGVSKFF